LIRYKQGFKYQLYDDYQVKTEIYVDSEVFCGRYLSLSEDGTLTIKDGYSWDGPSGPTIDSKNFMRGSLVHDAIYQLIRRGDIASEWREYADKLLRDICLEDGMCSVRAWYVYKSVRAFGGGAIQKPKEIIVAP
jgi:hypothetical protein